MRARARGVYALVAVAVVLAAGIASLLVGRVYRDPQAAPAPLGRRACTSAFDPLYAVAQGVPSDTCERNPGQVTPSIRAVLAAPDKVELLAGGQVVRTIATPVPVATLAGLAKVVGDAKWLSSVADQVTISSAVVARNGLELTVASPVTKGVTMDVRPGVFLAADRATLRLRGVTVQAATAATPAQGSRNAEADTIGRPFIAAFNRSIMTVEGSTVLYLGRDWNASYGLSWSSGSTGSVTHSVFKHDFIGVYANGAHGLTVSDNEFYDNSLYGIDPHSGSTGLLVERNLVERSGRHGIIFSDNVNNGVVRQNVTRDNGLNGIMMDASSRGNLIEGNLVEGNHSDGIVMASSPDNRIVGNEVRGNRIAIHVRGSSPTSEVVERNLVVGNDVMAKGVASLAGNRVDGNGGQWRPEVLAVLWPLASGVMLLLWLGTFAVRRRLERRPPARPAILGGGT